MDVHVSCEIHVEIRIEIRYYIRAKYREILIPTYVCTRIKYDHMVHTLK